jgi:hypothetical protein
MDGLCVTSFCSLIILLQMPTAHASLEDWWNSSVAGLSKDEERSVAAMLIYLNDVELVEGAEPKNLSGSFCDTSKSASSNQRRNESPRDSR